MNVINRLRQRFSFDQLMLIFTCFSLTFPYYICGPILIIETIYLLYTKKIINAYKETPKIKYLFIFLGISAAISLLYQNWIGLGCLIVILIFISLMVYFRKYINVETFEFILDMMIGLSILWAIYGIYEQLGIYQRLNTNPLTFKVFSRRENRLNSVFFNANYYAMMIEFIIMCIIYKFFTVKNDLKKSIFYVVVGFVNLFMLYMTGCRTAYIAIAGAIVVFLIINRNYKLCGLIGVGVLAICGFFVINPSKFPRIERLASNFSDRQDIWQAAVKGIKAHPIFGQGPMTYMMIFEKYHGHITQHAHSVYLDPILSFGFVGIIPAIMYIIDNCKRLFTFFKSNLNRSYVALVLSCITVILLHGTLDYTIFWLHTGLFFIFIACSFQMYENR